MTRWTALLATVVVLAAGAATAGSAADRSVSVTCRSVRWLTLRHDRAHHRFVLATQDLGEGTVPTVLAQIDRRSGTIVAVDRCVRASLAPRDSVPLTSPQAARLKPSVGCVPSEYDLGGYVNAPNGTIGVVVTYLRTGGTRLTLVHGRATAAIATVTPKAETVGFAPFYCR